MEGYSNSCSNLLIKRRKSRSPPVCNVEGAMWSPHWWHVCSRHFSLLYPDCIVAPEETLFLKCWSPQGDTRGTWAANLFAKDYSKDCKELVSSCFHDLFCTRRGTDCQKVWRSARSKGWVWSDIEKHIDITRPFPGPFTLGKLKLIEIAYICHSTSRSWGASSHGFLLICHVVWAKFKPSTLHRSGSPGSPLHQRQTAVARALFKGPKGLRTWTFVAVLKDP